jgi:hypothetical protein
MYLEIQSTPKHSHGEVELRYCETDKASLAHPVNQNPVLDVLHTQATSTSTTERKQVALQFWVVEPSLRLKSERLRKYGRVCVQKVRRLHDGCAVGNGVLFVHQVFVYCDARLAGGYAVCHTETFVNYGGLQSSACKDIPAPRVDLSY